MLITSKMSDKNDSNLSWSWIELCDDQGVFHVGGRVGAASGPRAFREVFSKFSGAESLKSKLSGRFTFDTPSANVRDNLQRAASVIENAQGLASHSVIVGGSHEHGYSQILGLKKAFPNQTIGCINLDAHFDLRKPSPEISSGSPYFLVIEENLIRPENFIEFGIQPQCNSQSLFDYAKIKKIKTHAFEDLRLGRSDDAFRADLHLLEQRCDVIAISLDLDCLAQAFAPAVSAPSAEGFSPSEIFEILKIAAKCEKVVSLGIFELNPIFDQDQKTARLAATAAFQFLSHALAQ